MSVPKVDGQHVSSWYFSSIFSIEGRSWSWRFSVGSLGSLSGAPVVDLGPLSEPPCSFDSSSKPFSKPSSIEALIDPKIDLRNLFRTKHWSIRKSIEIEAEEFALKKRSPPSMGVKYREKSSSETNIPTWKHYRAKPFGGENEQFSRTSVVQSKIVMKSHRSKKKRKALELRL